MTISFKDHVCSLRKVASLRDLVRTASFGRVLNHNVNQ